MKRLLILVLGLVAIAIVLHLWWRNSENHHVESTYTFALLNCPADEAWQVVSDLPRYSQWNPYIYKANVDREPAWTLHMTEKLPGGMAHTHTVKVEQWNNAGRILSWRGSIVPSSFLQWREVIEIVPVDATHSRLEFQQQFQGMLLQSYWKLYKNRNLEAAKAMAAALKQRCEAGTPATANRP